MRTELFDYELPNHFIAQTPAEPRDTSRLMILHRTTGAIEHTTFRQVGYYLSPGDLLIANQSRVIPARLFAYKPTGGRVEILLLQKLDSHDHLWKCLVRGRNIRHGMALRLASDHVPSAAVEGDLLSHVEEELGSGQFVLRFDQVVLPWLTKLGEIPLPPYITEFDGDRTRYQTVYADNDGSVAAPTAGLHFTEDLLLQLRAMGLLFDTVTLHVGLDTFRPVASEQIEDHEIHSEWAELTSEVAKRINQTSLQGSEIVAVGTTSARTLEWAATAAQGLDPYDGGACPWQRTAGFSGQVDLFIRPGYRFRAIDALITNFHLPRSSLLMMVSAFIAQEHADQPDTGREILLNAYQCAMREGYRFFSFGDAMLIL